MIATIAILTLALYWLLRETDYMRIRLLIGAWYVPVEYRRATWDKLKPYKNLPNFMRMHGYDPLCGWDWLKNHEHVLPDYSLYLAINNVRYTMTFGESATDGMLTEVMKVNTKKHKPYTGPRGKSLGPVATNPNWIQARLAEIEAASEPVAV